MRVSKWSTWPAAAALFALGGEALAGVPGGTVTYGQGVTAVPALSDLGLLLTGLLVAVIGFRMMRAGGGGRPLASVMLLGGLALTVGAVGPQAIQSARALPGYEFTERDGGSVDVPAFPGQDFAIYNSSGRPQQILQRTPRACAFTAPVMQPECSIGSTVNDAQECYVRLTNCQGPG